MGFSLPLSCTGLDAHLVHTDPAERSNLWNADVTQPGVWHLTVVPGNALSSSVSNAPDREERLGGLG